MSERYYKFNHGPDHRILIRVKWFVGGLIIAAPAIIGLFLLASTMFVEREPLPVASSVQTSVQAPSTQIFRTPYFQFQASKTWTNDAKESTDSKFVYRSYRGPLIEHDLVVYVNPPTQELDATRVQPVVAQNESTLQADDNISEHCETLLPDGQKDQEQTITLKGVTFKCDADDTIYDVLVGKVGGTPYMDLIRPDGSTAKYVILYRDHTAQPAGRELRDIVRSFQTR